MVYLSDQERHERDRVEYHNVPPKDQQYRSYSEDPYVGKNAKQTRNPVVLLLTFWVKWNQPFIAFFTIILFLVHFDNKFRPHDLEGFTTRWCDPANDDLRTSQEYNCIGPNLIWWGGTRPTGDWNFHWRSVFTYNPQQFFDLWIPLLFGAVGLAQHVGPQFRISAITSNWLRTSFFYLNCAIFGQFGFGGNFGVFWGFWTTCAFIPFALLLYCLYPESDTCLDMMDIPNRMKEAYGTDVEDNSHGSRRHYDENRPPQEYHQREDTGMSFRNDPRHSNTTGHAMTDSGSSKGYHRMDKSYVYE